MIQDKRNELDKKLRELGNLIVDANLSGSVDGAFLAIATLLKEERDLIEKQFAQQQCEMAEKVDYYEDRVKELERTADVWKQRYYMTKSDVNELSELIKKQSRFISRIEGGDFE